MIGQNLVMCPIIARHRKSTLVLLMTAAVGCGIAQAQTANSNQTARPLAPGELVIGLDQYGRLQYFSPVNGKWAETPTPSSTPAVDLNLGTGPNGQAAGAWRQSKEGWSADCSGNNCTITHMGDGRKEFSMSRKNLLSPLHFSPDGSKFFFIKKSPAWRVPPKCHLEDEYDLYVQNVADKNAKSVAVICGGFPYQALRWYQLPERSGQLVPR